MPGVPILNPVDQLARQFQQNGLIVWWKQNIGQNYNPPTEYGTDYNMPYRSKVGSITSGTVVYAGKPPDSLVPGHTSLGYVVQVVDASGSVVHYQHLDSLNPSIQVGSQIQTGDWVGLSGGCAAGSTATNCISDSWSTGPHIEVRYASHYSAAQGLWGQNWVNPSGLFLNLQQRFPTATPPTAQVNQPACAPWDIGCILSGLNGFLVSAGEHIAIFVLAIVLIIVGFFLLAGRSIKV